MSHCEPGGGTLTEVVSGTTRVALLGSPNSGKTTLFNSLTGLRAKTGNYPGVTVARYEGAARTSIGDVAIEDLPGTYSLDPISPDEEVVRDVLDGSAEGLTTPDALLVLLDATTVERSLTLVGQALNTGIPATVVLTFGDELHRRMGSVDVPALERALGAPVLAVPAGYLSRAAFLMDRLMARAGLEGRAFVALLSAWACAIPGIMATRSLPSARDRIATMMGAPLMTCSARFTVYVLLVGLLVPSSAGIGPFGAQGVVMFVLYFVGALAAMATAWVFKRITGRHGAVLPFYMEMPSYRLPRFRSVAFAVWDSSKAFLQKVGRIILVVTIVLWLLLNLPTRSATEMQHAGVDTTNSSATSAYVLDHSLAADVGKAVEPVFEPLGFDWRVNVGVLASLSAREVFVATLGQVAAAENPESPKTTLQHMTTERNGHQEKLFDAPTTAALLVHTVVGAIS